MWPWTDWKLRRALRRYRHRWRAAQAAPAPQPVGEGC